ncbi:MAG: hypothetical protein IJ679_03950 [Lachnospiraceae bacterium]|nr:hypothetical protein [Lachnospiraceae bacterium]
MKKMRRWMAVLTLFAVFFAAMPLTGQAANSYMQKTGVKWGIRAGKSYTFPAYYNGISATKPIEWTISRPRISKPNKNGYRRMIFTMNMVNLSDFTQEETDIICQQEEFGGGYAWFLVDENTGKSLEAKNKFGVSCRVKVLDQRAIDGYLNSDESITFYPERRFKARVTLTYPEDYEGLCLGVGTYKHMTSFSSSDAKFFNGKIPLNKSTMFKKSKNCLRFTNLLKL